MKIRDILIDKLAETSLFEMVYARKVAIDRTRDLQMQIAKHLVKIEMYSNLQTVNHWCTELNAWLDNIQDYRLKNTNKPLDKDTLFKLLFDEPLGTVGDVQARMNRISKEYPTAKIIQPDAREVHQRLYWIVKQICEDISNEKFIEITRYI